MTTALMFPSTQPTLATLTSSGAMSRGMANSILASYERMLENGTLAKSKAAGISLAEGIPVVGTAALVGGALGALHCSLAGGLDVKIPGTKQSLPVDGVLAALGLLAGAGAAYDGKPGVGNVVHGAAATCMGIYSFRKVHDLLTDMKLKRSGVGAGAQVQGLKKIGKTAFAGEDDVEFGAEGGWAAGSVVKEKSWSPFGSDDGEDPIVKAARSL